MKTLKLCLHGAYRVLLWVILIGAIAVLISALLIRPGAPFVPSLFGKTFLTVGSGSMEPVLRPGDLILTDLLDDEERASLAVGDIITYYVDLNGDGTDELNTHKVVGTEQGTDGSLCYITRGENNPTNDDEPVPQDRILGRYVGFRIGGVGHAVSFLRSPTGLFFCMVLPLFLFFLYALIHFVNVLHELRTQKRSEDEVEEIKRRAVEEYLREQGAQSKEH